MAEYFVGVMSGTSVDAVDAVLCQIDTSGRVTSEQVHSLPFPLSLATRLHHAMSPDIGSLLAFKQLEADYSLHVAKAVNQLLENSSVSATQVTSLGCHGQTLWHLPPSQSGASAPFSLQLINAPLIARQTGIDVICDFRQKDIAVGGEGAPLVPAFHYHVLAQQCPTHSVVLNLGGIANLTYLGADTTGVIGFDTGPANTLSDAVFRQHVGAPGYDQQGELAASGTVITQLLSSLLGDSYFQQSPPKSTGRERFNLAWLTHQLDGSEPIKDILRTLIELTAVSVVEAMQFLPAQPTQVIACGGGVLNQTLMSRLQTKLNTIKLTTTAHYGIDPQAVEAMAFAWLAWCYEHKKPGNLPAVTGASHPVILGSKTYSD